MSDTVIKAENLGKKYIIGHQGEQIYKTFREQMVHGIHNVFSKTKQMFSGRQIVEGDKIEEFWALKDVSFEVKQGETIGIIGRNGAGKSTLLKILSRITEPTTGRVAIKGRVASLLEVGTGFHPELTGRENIFLNGAILGMSHSEIKRKFDDIVDFSGVEKFLDTPVKRFSSGMYVRLAFSVAAHLEPEILVVDEVLAVGDAEFQKKCLGKMEDVSSRQGRTVLFVSHNMESILKLCNNSFLLQNGELVEAGNTKEVIDLYLSKYLTLKSRQNWNEGNAPSDGSVRLLSVYLHDADFNSKTGFEVTEPIGISFEYEVLTNNLKFTHGLNLFNDKGINIFNSHDVTSGIRIQKREPGRYKATAWIPRNLLSEGIYIIGGALFSPNPLYIHIHQKEILVFEVSNSMNELSARGDYTGSDFGGVVRPLLNWETKVIS